MITSEIFDKTYQYLNGEISLSDLENWVAARFGLFAALPQSSSRDLYGTIELGLAEISIGHRSEEEFRALMRDFIRSRDLVFAYPPEYQADYADSASGLQIDEWDSRMPVQQWTHAGIELERAS